jgi:hypothetical protein
MALHRKCELKKGHLYCIGSVKMVLAGHFRSGYGRRYGGRQKAKRRIISGVDWYIDI